MKKIALSLAVFKIFFIRSFFVLTDNNRIIAERNEMGKTIRGLLSGKYTKLPGGQTVVILDHIYKVRNPPYNLVQ